MANINIRIDGETKKKAEQVFSKLGMNPRFFPFYVGPTILNVPNGLLQVFLVTGR
jgi:hypothetical protein